MENEFHDFESHKIEIADAFAWYVPNRAPKGHNEYWFKVLWTRGFLICAGDIGSVVTTHYGAFGSLSDAVGWMKDAHFDYWASKTDSKQEYDPDGTRQDLYDILCQDEAERVWNGRYGPDGIRPRSFVKSRYEAWGAVQHIVDWGINEPNYSRFNTRAKRKKLLDELHLESVHELEQFKDEMHNLTGFYFYDWHGRYSYPYSLQLQWRALKWWANNVDFSAE